MTAAQLLTIVTVVARVVSVASLVLLASGLVGVAVVMVLSERRRGYRMPYEQPSHVRLLRGDES